ncbi:MAG: uracil-DNA glycosylase [Gemmatimonadota bacterium]
MPDPLRRYLAAQRDLGGDEVLFDVPVALPATVAVAPRTRASAATPVAPATPASAAPAPAAIAAAPSRPRVVPVISEENAVGWRKGAPPIPGPGLVVNVTAPDRWSTLAEVADVVSTCTQCPLCTGRTKTVPGEGNAQARLMLIGEGPGETEDLTGRPFVGRAGELLDKILESIEAPRATVFIANVVKCRPPRNRAPLPDERAACLPYLHRQIALVKPKVLLALGSTAAEAMLGVKKPLGEIRLKVHEWNGIPLIVTYHPAALLRNPNWKRPAWDDVRIARQLLDIDD